MTYSFRYFSMFIVLVLAYGPVTARAHSCQEFLNQFLTRNKLGVYAKLNMKNVKSFEKKATAESANSLSHIPQFKMSLKSGELITAELSDDGRNWTLEVDM